MGTCVHTKSIEVKLVLVGEADEFLERSRKPPYSNFCLKETAQFFHFS
jgi:hypothetical protein